MIENTNDGSQREPYLRFDINYCTLHNLPSFSNGPAGTDHEKHSAIKAAGFGGIQDGDPLICKDLGLGLTAHARINGTGELLPLVNRWLDENYECATIHLGWGMESDDQMNTLVDDVISTSVKRNFPVYIETHRATVTQDMQRTVALTERFPEIRFNGDFSHWYTGQEMVYGGIENKWEFLAPVFERVRYVHGRIGDPGSIQVDIGDGKDLSYVNHFREMWTRSFEGFLTSAKPGDFICFTAELLPAEFFYARTIKDQNGHLIEEGDRWQQTMVYKEIAALSWSDAVSRVASLKNN